MDDSSLTGRLKRYAQVSTAMTGLAARMAGERYLGFEIDRIQHAQSLTALLGGLKGPLMKVAQFLATVPGALPPEYAEELLELQSNAPAMGWAFVRRRMASELGPYWQDLFQEFSQEAAAAASLGQVHKGVLKSGETVACKLQYAGMQTIIEADLNQLNLIFSMYESWNKAVQTTNIRQEIEDRLREELDYHNEARNLKIYGEIFKPHPRIHLPHVYDEFSTGRLLTMSWEDGVSFLDKVNSPQEERDDLAKLLFEAWYTPFYQYGLIHGDPHPGNYRLKEDQLTLLDLGCVRIFPGTFVAGVVELYRSLQENDRERAVYAYESWGFENLTNEAIDVITLWAKLLFDPLLDDRVRFIQEDLHGAVGWETATKVHEELNKIGGIHPPREFVFMDRATVGIGSVIMRLKAQQNWHRLFNELIEGVHSRAIQERQDKLINSI